MVYVAAFCYLAHCCLGTRSPLAHVPVPNGATCDLMLFVITLTCLLSISSVSLPGLSLDPVARRIWCTIASAAVSASTYLFRSLDLRGSSLFTPWLVAAVTLTLAATIYLCVPSAPSPLAVAAYLCMLIVAIARYLVSSGVFYVARDEMPPELLSMSTKSTHVELTLESILICVVCTSGYGPSTWIMCRLFVATWTHLSMPMITRRTQLEREDQAYRRLYVLVAPVLGIHGIIESLGAWVAMILAILYSAAARALMSFEAVLIATGWRDYHPPVTRLPSRVAIALAKTIADTLVAETWLPETILTSGLGEVRSSRSDATSVLMSRDALSRALIEECRDIDSVDNHVRSAHEAAPDHITGHEPTDLVRPRWVKRWPWSGRSHERRFESMDDSCFRLPAQRRAMLAVSVGCPLCIHFGCDPFSIDVSRPLATSVITSDNTSINGPLLRALAGLV